MSFRWQEIKVGKGEIRQLAFRWSGSHLAYATSDPSLGIWCQGASPWELPCDGASIDTLAWSMDDHRLAAGATDGRVFVFEISGLAAVKSTTFETGNSPVRGLAFGQNDELIVGHRNGSLCAWDLRTSKRRIIGDVDCVSDLVFLSGSCILVVATANALQFFDNTGNNWRVPLDFAPKGLGSADGGGAFAVVGDDQCVLFEIANTRQTVERGRIRADGGSAFSAVRLSNQRLVISAGKQLVVGAYNEAKISSRSLDHPVGDWAPISLHYPWLAAKSLSGLGIIGISSKLFESQANSSPEPRRVVEPTFPTVELVSGNGVIRSKDQRGTNRMIPEVSPLNVAILAAVITLFAALAERRLSLGVKSIVVGAVLLVIVTLLINRVQPRTKSAEQVAGPESRYERNDGNLNVLVFLHGLHGGTDDDWTAEQPGVASWPRMILTDPTFNEFDVYLASYHTPRVGNRLTIDQVVAMLHNRFQSDQIFNHKNVVFVCHSLGGIVCLRYLLTYREDAAKTPLIYLFGTPQEGSSLARWGRIFDGDPYLKALIPGDQNNYLENLETEWLAAGFKTKKLCAFETELTRGVIVVDRASATRGCDGNPAPITRNHIDLVRPTSKHDDSYIALALAVRPLAARTADTSLY